QVGLRGRARSQRNALQGPEQRDDRGDMDKPAHDASSGRRSTETPAPAGASAPAQTVLRASMSRTPAAIRPKLSQYAAGSGPMYRLSVRMRSMRKRTTPERTKYSGGTSTVRSAAARGSRSTRQESTTALSRLMIDS